MTLWPRWWLLSTGEAHPCPLLLLSLADPSSPGLTDLSRLGLLHCRQAQVKESIVGVESRVGLESSLGAESYSIPEKSHVPPRGAVLGSPTVRKILYLPWPDRMVRLMAPSPR
jgi:hypothetical protein